MISRTPQGPLSTWPDIDGDECDEVLVSEPGLGWYYVPWTVLYTAVYVLQEPWQDGVLEEEAFATFSGIGGSDGWGYPARLLPLGDHFVISGYDDSAHKVHFHELPSVAGTTVFADTVGSLDTTTSYGPINSLSARWPPTPVIRSTERRSPLVQETWTATDSTTSWSAPTLTWVETVRLRS